MRDELDYLLAKAYAVHPRARSPYSAVDRLMSKAIGQIRDSDYQKAALWEFGLGESASRSSHARREHIYGEIFGVSEKTFRRSPRYERLLIEMVAEEIERVATVASADFLPIVTAPYIIREQLLGRIEVLWELSSSDWIWQTSRRICVIGEPGSGKSSYVRESCNSESLAWINAATVDSLTQTIADVLENYGVDASHASVSALKHEFGKLLCRDDGPKLVVIDDMDDPMQLDQFLPRQTRTRLVVTSCQQPTEDWAPCIYVGEMNHNEATEMVEAHCPDLSVEQCAQLGGMLSGRPLAIAQACAYLNRNADVDVDQFCRALSEDTTAALNPLGERSELTLVATYQQILEKVLTQHPKSIDLLEFLAFVGHANVTPRCLLSYLAKNPRNLRDDDIRIRLTYSAAMRPLVELCLIQVEKTYIRLSPLTRALYRNLLHSRQDALQDRIFTFFSYDRDHLLSEVDLFDLGWPERDIASYLQCRALYTLRVAMLDVEDASAMDIADFSETISAPDQPAGDGGILFDHFLETHWETLYLLCRFLSTPEGSFLLASTDRTDRDTWDDFFERVDIISGGAAIARSPVAPELAERLMAIFYAELASKEEIDAWLSGYNMSMGKADYQLARWQRIYNFYLLLEEMGKSLEPNNEATLTGRELIRLCRLLVDKMAEVNWIVKQAQEHSRGDQPAG
jgi:hypothetical protein